MAHFAQLNENNIVTSVIVVNNTELLDENDAESEDLGVSFCKSLFGNDTIWVQTSYSGSFRKNYAGVGASYDITRDAFIAPQPFNSWSLNEVTCRWVSPVAYPSDGGVYSWDETTLNWVDALLPPAIDYNNYTQPDE